MKLVSDSIAQLKPYEAGKPLEELARELGVTDAIKLASNENAIGPSPKARAAILEAIVDLQRYPDAAQFALREKVSKACGVASDEVTFGNGSNELLELLVRTFCTPNEHIVFGHPSFVVYRMAALAQGVPFSAVPLRDQVHDLDAMLAAVQPNTRLVFIANPNNPTGTYVARNALESFLSNLRSDVIVALDEAYIEYTDAADFPDGLELRQAYPRLVVLRTFSKIYGLAALRLGYAIGDAELIYRMNCVRAPFNTSSIAQAAGLAALDDAEHVEKSRKLNSSERSRITEALTSKGIHVVPSQANFVLVDVARPATEVYDQLLRKGVIVRPIPPLPTCLRVTIGLPRENDRFLAALAEVLS
jgi:histidinol-phosphate aminotransferase